MHELSLLMSAVADLLAVAPQLGMLAVKTLRR